MSFLPNLYNITKQPFGKENQVTFATISDMAQWPHVPLVLQLPVFVVNLHIQHNF